MKRKQFAYEKLANILRAQILSGYIKPGEYVMSENELCKYYGLSRTSVRKAMELLVKEGLITRNIGQGTKVASNIEIKQENKKNLHIIQPFETHYGDNGLSIIIDRFQDFYPDVDVKVLSFPVSNFWESVRVCAEMGLHADIILTSDRQFKELDHFDEFVDVQEIIEPYEASIYPKLLQTFKIDEEIKAVPGTFSTVFLAINPSLFRQFQIPIPTQNWNLEQFIDIAKKLTVDSNQDGITDKYGISLSTSFLRWPIFALQNGTQFWNDDSQPNSMLKTFQLLHELLYRHKVATISQPTIGKLNSDAFIRNKAAMVLTTTFETAGWISDNPSLDFRIVPLPFGNIKSTLLMSDAFLISAKSKNIKLARNFIRTAIDIETQVRISKEAKFLSIHKHINDKIWSENEVEAMNIQNYHLNNCNFLHELFPESSITEDLESDMDLFWSGLESANDMCNKWMLLMSSRM